MTRFYHIDIDEEAEEYSAICEQNMDKFGVSAEANEQVLKDLDVKRNKVFLDHIEGKLTKDEWVNIDNKLEALG